ncbi:hypothetical protein M422DRAFT_264266 [Sphaerobolus stellatus SS14]|uniref:Unplaced genomic scaffold SPHSTscaffold_133, whole genome shotgun sequence n=1 Tax=Sphaerobolus stellatus (strain SS14) TaxID=990650 RepID=A0A0C9UG89_SPHS4|nr:hypothetical protein M422DRAFT_264266 [Sphaerobolus stellatus SS14]
MVSASSWPLRTTRCTLFVHSAVLGALGGCAHRVRAPRVAVRAPSFPTPPLSQHPPSWPPRTRWCTLFVHSAVLGDFGGCVHRARAPRVVVCAPSFPPSPLSQHPPSWPPRTRRCTLFVHSAILGGLGNCAHCARAPRVVVRTVRTPSLPPPPPLSLHQPSWFPRMTRCTPFVHNDVLEVIGDFAHLSPAPLVAVRTVRAPLSRPPAAFPTPARMAP